MRMRKAGLAEVAVLVGVLLGAGCAAARSGSPGAASAGAGNVGSQTAAVTSVGARGGDTNSGTGGAEAGRLGSGSGRGAAGASAGGGAVQVHEYADSDGAGHDPVLPTGPRAVLDLFAQGAGCQEIAGKLGLESSEVNAVVAGLGARSALEALVLAARRGLFRPGPR